MNTRTEDFIKQYNTDKIRKTIKKKLARDALKNMSEIHSLAVPMCCKNRFDQLYT